MGRMSSVSFISFAVDGQRQHRRFAESTDHDQRAFDVALLTFVHAGKDRCRRRDLDGGGECVPASVLEARESSNGIAATQVLQADVTRTEFDPGEVGA